MSGPEAGRRGGEAEFVRDRNEIPQVPQLHRALRAVFLKDMPDRWVEIKRLARLNLEFLDDDVFFDAKPYLGTSYTERTPLMGEIRREGIDL